jgi:putative endonuclease
MSSYQRTPYIGVTNDPERRVFEHKTGVVPGFTSKYRITRLVHFEETDDVSAAIEREKPLKGWLRKRKIELIESTNPKWLDFAADWFTPDDLRVRTEESTALNTLRRPQSSSHHEHSEGSSPVGSVTPAGKLLRCAQDDRESGLGKGGRSGDNSKGSGEPRQP